MYEVYFISRLSFIFHTFLAVQLLFTLHVSLSCNMCMRHLVVFWQCMLISSHDCAWLACVHAMFIQGWMNEDANIKHEVSLAQLKLSFLYWIQQASTATLHCNNCKLKRSDPYKWRLLYSFKVTALPRLHIVATVNSDVIFCKQSKLDKAWHMSLYQLCTCIP